MFQATPLAQSKIHASKNIMFASTASLTFTTPCAHKPLWLRQFVFTCERLIHNNSCSSRNFLAQAHRWKALFGFCDMFRSTRASSTLRNSTRVQANKCHWNSHHKMWYMPKQVQCALTTVMCHGLTDHWLIKFCKESYTSQCSLRHAKLPEFEHRK